MGLESLRALQRKQRTPDPVRVARGRAVWAKTKALYDKIGVANVTLKMYGVNATVVYYGRQYIHMNNDMPLRIDWRDPRRNWETRGEPISVDRLEQRIQEIIAVAQ